MLKGKHNLPMLIVWEGMTTLEYAHCLRACRKQEKENYMSYWERPTTLKEAWSLVESIRVEMIGIRQNALQKEAALRICDCIKLLIDEINHLKSIEENRI